VVAVSALDRFPAAPLQAALEALGHEVDASPRLVIRAGALDDQARARIEQLCADAGFQGVVAYRDEPGLPAAAFRLEWSDGRADFDPAAAFDRMAEALRSALAAEAGHAETLNDGRP
jgi:flagellar assembly protein FliH